MDIAFRRGVSSTELCRRSTVKPDKKAYIHKRYDGSSAIVIDKGSIDTKGTRPEQSGSTNLFNNSGELCWTEEWQVITTDVSCG